MSQAIQKADQPDEKILEQVITKGDLTDLTPAQRVVYYNAVCRSLELNPLTRPFDFMKVKGPNNKEIVILYARKDCTEQLRKKHKVSIYQLDHRLENDCLIVTAHARTPDGREDVDEGAVYLKGLIGNDAANALLRATTKAKRRVTLSICGLGFLDESEVGSIAGAQPVTDINDNNITVSQKASGLDQWKCGRKLAMDLISVCKRLEAQGINDEQMRAKLPKGVQSRKDLTEAQAKAALEEFNAWLAELESDAVQGEVVNG